MVSMMKALSVVECAVLEYSILSGQIVNIELANHTKKN